MEYKQTSIAWVELKPKFIEGKFYDYEANKMKGTLQPKIFRFHDVIRPVLILSQFFGIFPLSGVWIRDSSKLSFHYKSYIMLYTLLDIILAVLSTVASLIKVLTSRIEISKITSLMFFGINLLIIINYVFLAKKWPDLIKYWNLVEMKLPQHCDAKRSRRMSDKHYRFIQQMRIIAGIFMLSSVVETTLSKVSAYSESKDCFIQDKLEAFIKQSFPDLIDAYGFNYFVGFWGMVVTTICTFSWNFNDLLLILISIELTEKFRILNDIIIKSDYKLVRSSFWRDQWNHYKNICSLVDKTNEGFSVLIILSYSINLYIICVQLLNIFKPITSKVQGAYLWYSLFHIIVKTLFVSLYASKIHDESKKSVSFFRTIPNECFTEDVRRFEDHVKTATVALSGYRFFNLTRRLILKIAGTIVTYELVMVQFNEADEKVADEDPCN